MNIAQSQIVQVLIGGRCSYSSTEIIPCIEGLEIPEFWLELWGEDKGKRSKMGYAKFELATTNGLISEGTYQLAQLLPASSPAPHPVISMSGVLWPRQRVLLQLEQGGSSLQVEHHSQGFSFQGSRAECPHES